MDGVLLIDKPSGPTSFAAVARVRRLCRMRQVGHAGTLDPLASGLLLILIGRATRIARYLEPLPKEYQARIRLGLQTDTDDLEGREISRFAVPELERSDLESKLQRFLGPIEQVPPQYSAIKRNGQPLYQMARQGLSVALPPRRVEIYNLSLLYHGREEIEILVRCSKGTYIRSLARDIGQSLGCGATLAGLVRRAVGEFRREQAVPLSALDSNTVEGNLMTIDKALSFIPEMDLSASEYLRAVQGNIFFRPGWPDQAGPVRLKHQGTLVALARTSEGTIRPECVLGRR